MLAQHGLQGRRAVCGVSGGPDSMVLLHVMGTLQKQSQVFSSLAVAHVNHGLRGEEAEADEELVRTYCQTHQLEFHCLKLEGKAPQTGIQAWGRNKRLEFFHGLKGENGIIILGQHRDDVAESMLMRMARGVSAGQMSGMVNWHEGVLRPFLAVAKADLIACADRHQIPTRYDSSNNKLLYTRNRIRLQVLPVLDELYAGAAGRISALGQDMSDILSWCRAQWQKEGLDLEKGILWQWFRTLPTGVAIEVLATYLKDRLGTDLQLSRQTLRACATADARQIRALSVAKGWHLAVKGGRLQLAPSRLSPRFAQHKAALGAEMWQGTLPPGGFVLLPFRKPLRISSRHEAWLALSVKDHLAMTEEERDFCAAASSQPLDRTWIKLVTVKGHGRGVYDGDNLHTLEGESQKIMLEDWLVSIQNHGVLGMEFPNSAETGPSRFKSDSGLGLL